MVRHEVQQTLRNELKSTITALLRSCEMALQVPDLQSEAKSRMRAIHTPGGAPQARRSHLTLLRAQVDVYLILDLQHCCNILRTGRVLAKILPEHFLPHYNDAATKNAESRCFRGCPALAPGALCTF